MTATEGLLEQMLKLTDKEDEVLAMCLPCGEAFLQDAIADHMRSHTLEITVRSIKAQVEAEKQQVSEAKS